MEGNLLQAIAAGLFCGFFIVVSIWQLISTSLAKKRRIKREQALKAETAGLGGGAI